MRDFPRASVHYVLPENRSARRPHARPAFGNVIDSAPRQIDFPRAAAVRHSERVYRAAPEIQKRTADFPSVAQNFYGFVHGVALAYAPEVDFALGDFLYIEVLRVELEPSAHGLDFPAAFGGFPPGKIVAEAHVYRAPRGRRRPESLHEAVAGVPRELHDSADGRRVYHVYVAPLGIHSKQTLEHGNLPEALLGRGARVIVVAPAYQQVEFGVHCLVVEFVHRRNLCRKSLDAREPPFKHKKAAAENLPRGKF